jgi:outer membrane protein W
MLRRLVVLIALVFLAATPSAFAQKAEVSATVGWTLSDGVTASSPVLAPDGNIYDAADLKDSFSWGLSGGYHVTDQVEVGFMWGQQLSKLDLEGTRLREVGDLTVNTYHGYVGFNFFDTDAKVRPYFLFGLGATNFGSVNYTNVLGQARSTGSETQFSTTWGAGVKIFGKGNVGARAGIQWTPTYIKSDPGGYWCDPYWGCYLVGDPQYANQFQFGGGVIFRF